MGLTWGLVPVMLLMDLLTPPMPAGLEKQHNDEAVCCQELFSTPADVKKKNKHLVLVLSNVMGEWERGQDQGLKGTAER